MKIGVISDSHNLLRAEVLEALQGCAYILHAGDISKKEILDKLNTIAPVYAVRGNNDKEWACYLPQYLDMEIDGLRIFMTHKKKDLPEDLSPYGLVVYGHSHKFDLKEKKRNVILNPGSCGPRRFDQDITMAVLKVNKSGIQVKKILIPHEPEDSSRTKKSIA